MDKGIYRHFKGGIYQVHAVALHSETKEELVVYTNLNTGVAWVRPISMFTDEARPGVKRFELIERNNSGLESPATVPRPDKVTRDLLQGNQDAVDRTTHWPE